MTLSNYVCFLNDRQARIHAFAIPVSEPSKPLSRIRRHPEDMDVDAVPVARAEDTAIVTDVEAATDLLAPEDDDDDAPPGAQQPAPNRSSWRRFWCCDGRRRRLVMCFPCVPSGSR